MAIITLDALMTAEAILPSSKPSEMQLRKKREKSHERVG
jgi:hypothetical protein